MPPSFPRPEDDEPGRSCHRPDDAGPEPVLGLRPRASRVAASMQASARFDRSSVMTSSGNAADDVVIADAESLAEPEPADGQGLSAASVRDPPSEFQRSSIRASRSRPLGPGLKPVEQRRVADQDLAEVLAGAEDLEQDLGRSSRFSASLRRSRLSIALPGDEPLEIGQRHARLGTARQDVVELAGNPGDRTPAGRDRAI